MSEQPRAQRPRRKLLFVAWTLLWSVLLLEGVLQVGALFFKAAPEDLGAEVNPDAVRVLAVGDSWVEGAEAPEGQGFVDHLGREFSAALAPWGLALDTMQADAASITASHFLPMYARLRAFYQTKRLTVAGEEKPVAALAPETQALHAALEGELDRAKTHLEQTGPDDGPVDGPDCYVYNCIHCVKL